MPDYLWFYLFTENQIKPYNLVAHIINLFKKSIDPFKNLNGIIDSLLYPQIFGNDNYFKMIKDIFLAVPLYIYIAIILLLVTYAALYGSYEYFYPLNNLKNIKGFLYQVPDPVNYYPDYS